MSIIFPATLFYLKDALWNDILQRYLAKEPMHEQVMRQIDNAITDDDYVDDNIGGIALA